MDRLSVNRVIHCLIGQLFQLQYALKHIRCMLTNALIYKKENEISETHV